MGYNELEVELRKTLDLIARWRELGYMPVIEQGIALGRLQKIYAGLLDLPCGEPEASVVEEAESVAPGAVVPEGGWSAEQEPEVVLPADEAEVGDFRSEEEAGLAEETHLRQDDEAHDLCPPVTEFPAAREVVTDAEEELEERAVEEKKVEEGGLSEETHLRQDDEAHDLCPPATEFPEAEHRPVSEPELPKIFGIEVSPYARHEIIDTLFHGNTELFEAETEKLDGMESLEEALVYIGETYRWIPENAATIKFIDLLESRFEE